jgi:hypothetical protein
VGFDVTTEVTKDTEEEDGLIRRFAQMGADFGMEKRAHTKTPSPRRKRGIWKPRKVVIWVSEESLRNICANPRNLRIGQVLPL